MLVQILCNKKYSCPKTESNSLSSSESDSSENLSMHKEKKQKKQKKRQQTTQLKKIKKEPLSIRESTNSVSFDELKSSILKKSDCHNTSLTSQLSPSFNIKTNMKSTPVRPCQNCETVLKNTSSVQTAQISSEKKSNRKNAPDTIVDVHAQPNFDVSDIEVDTSFQSC